MMLAWTTLFAQPERDGGGPGSLIPLLALIFFIISAIRAARQARQAKQRPAEPEDYDEERRAREIRERLRRVAAERRGEAVPPDLGQEEAPPARSARESAEETSEPPRRTPPAPTLDPFGGPMRRILEEWERRLTPPSPVPPVVVAQEPETPPRAEPPVRLMPPLSPAATTPPPVTTTFPVRTTAQAFSLTDPTKTARATARRALLEDLQDPMSLRRALVLREVLGPPVSMRH